MAVVRFASSSSVSSDDAGLIIPVTHARSRRGVTIARTSARVESGSARALSPEITSTIGDANGVVICHARVDPPTRSRCHAPSRASRGGERSRTSAARPRPRASAKSEAAYPPSISRPLPRIRRHDAAPAMKSIARARPNFRQHGERRVRRGVRARASDSLPGRVEIVRGPRILAHFVAARSRVAACIAQQLEHDEIMTPWSSSHAAESPAMPPPTMTVMRTIFPEAGWNEPSRRE